MNKLAKYDQLKPFDIVLSFPFSLARIALSKAFSNPFCFNNASFGNSRLYFFSNF